MPQPFPGFQNSIIDVRAGIASEKGIEIHAAPVSEQSAEAFSFTR
jgi:hypothetical protein